MRVISGKVKGHRLKSPKGNKVRPTEDRIKESIFNIIGYIESDSLVLDAFGGTGSIGIEFLSRGAYKAYFVDNYYDSIVAIRENLSHTKLLESSEIINSDIFIAINEFNKEKLKFDYIYLDPPFNQKNLLDKAFEAIEKKDILELNGIVIVEYGKEIQLDDLMYGFKRTDHRIYGNKCIDFYEKNIEEAPDESSLSRQF